MLCTSHACISSGGQSLQMSTQQICCNQKYKLKKKIEKPNNSEITPQNVMKHIQVYQVCQIPIKSGLPVLRLFLFNEIMCIIAKHTQLTRTSEKYKYPVSTEYK